MLYIILITSYKYSHYSFFGVYTPTLITGEATLYAWPQPQQGESCVPGHGMWAPSATDVSSPGATKDCKGGLHKSRSAF